MADSGSSAPSADLMPVLQETLKSLLSSPYPHVPNPESCKRRASVAVVLRIRPQYDHWPEPSSVANRGLSDLTGTEFLDRFFTQTWVKHGDPEIVFIKRAARVGDRWTSHVALPGGKRDPEDEDDKAVAIRETAEEIGLDLTSGNALYVGNLPERVVSTSWGKVPIMVLCPFLFLWTTSEMPPLRLQPTEVASTHWVPLRVLLSPSTRTYEYVDVSDRFARRGGPVVKAVIRTVLGKMRFSAVRLIPSESLYCSSTAEYFSSPEADAQLSSKTTTLNKIYNWYMGDHAASSGAARPLLLWGLTLGVMADFLDQLPPHNAVKLWSYPTFTSMDVRWVINILSLTLKRRNRARLQSAGSQNQTAMDNETEAVATGDNPWFIGGLSGGMEASNKGKNATKSYAVGIMLDGYYDIARKGVWLAATFRLIATILLGWQIVKRFRRAKI